MKICSLTFCLTLDFNLCIGYGGSQVSQCDSLLMLLTIKIYYLIHFDFYTLNIYKHNNSWSMFTGSLVLRTSPKRHKGRSDGITKESLRWKKTRISIMHQVNLFTIKCPTSAYYLLLCGPRDCVT